MNKSNPTNAQWTARENFPAVAQAEGTQKRG